ncbi:TetR/AcrR family transcriptional regulator [Salinibacter altiplanensis]|uniref:TetR/AcrR family transcriptional regulator n=1 Tax=Salinibacter altiplanensis TaxID=1803181 RepID=UPI000C9F8054|nr:TetR/AcrR family transcriptional regulator [Salinibacter altiplanensis]
MHTPNASSTEHTDTATRILDAAQDLVQQCGYNAVSYGDLADVLGLTTAAIHYHFSTKADLGQALVARYRKRNAAARSTIWAEEDGARGRLEQYVNGYVGILEHGGLCLCGVLAADDETLPEPVRREVRHFFAEQEDWLTTVIAEAHAEGAGLAGYDSPRGVAELLLATIEGAMLTTRDRGPDAYRARLHRLIDTIVS